MELTLEEKFRKHVFKVVRDKYFRELVFEYYNDLKQHYKGKFFTRDNFSTLVVNGKEIEQDIIIELFKHNDKVSAEDVFAYLFINNVDQLKLFSIGEKMDKSLKNFSGFYDSSTKSIGLRHYTPRQYIKAFHPFIERDCPVGVSYKEWRKICRAHRKEWKKSIKEKENGFKDELRLKIKNVLYHELSHVFETKTFDNRRFQQCGIEKRVFVVENKKLIATLDAEITDEAIDTYCPITITDKLLTTLSPQQFINNGISIGACALGETLNENFTCSLSRNFRILPKQHFSTKLSTIKIFESGCSYNDNYDICAFLQIALIGVDRKDFRFNTISIVKRINELQISENSLIEAKQKFIQLFAPTINQNFFVELIPKINALDTYSFICFVMGIEDSWFANADYHNRKWEYKAIIETILLEAITNNIKTSFKAPPIKKPLKFFKDLQKTLCVLDDFICRPTNTSWFEEPGDEIVDTYQVSYSDILDLAVIDAAKKYPEQTNLKAFAKLISMVEATCKQYMPQDKLYEIMPYFLAQDQLIAEQKQRIRTHAKALKLLQAKKEGKLANQSNNQVEENMEQEADKNSISSEQKVGK